MIDIPAAIGAFSDTGDVLEKILDKISSLLCSDGILRTSHQTG